MCYCCKTAVKPHHETHHWDTHHSCCSYHKGYLTKEEEIEKLKEYMDELKREIEVVERKIEELK